MASADDIASYYDKNTRHFLSLGGSGDVAAIHRAIWVPGIVDRASAFNYLNTRVADALLPCLQEDKAQTSVLDLGCGVGGTSTWLAQALGIQVTGVTISREQQQQASSRASALGLSDQCRFLQGDFAAMPDLSPVDAAFAIESFVHASDASAFFGMAANVIKPGGRLIICDDFLARQPREPRSLFWVNRFKQGWQLNNLITPESAIHAASAAGFNLLQYDDLSAYTRSFHPLVLALVSQSTRLPLPWSYWQNLAGGTALQICLKRGWTLYGVLVLEKQA